MEHRTFQGFIIGLIVVNAIMIGLETYPGFHGPVMRTLDQIVLAIFTTEVALRIFAHGWRFFTDGWSVFDFLVVVISSIPSGGSLQVLRVLRVLRLLSTVSSLRKVVGALGSAIPGIGAIGALLVIVMYVFVVACTMLFGGIAPEMFGDLGASTVSLFRLLNGDGWGEIVPPLTASAPWAWPFMMIYGLVSTFVILNLFIAVTCEALEHQKETVAAPSPVEQRLLDEIAALRDEVRALSRSDAAR